MTIARIYVMKAANGAELEGALHSIAETMRGLPGCESVELLRDLDDETRYIFHQRWASTEAHNAARAHLPQEAKDRLAGALAARPDGAYYGALAEV